MSEDRVLGKKYILIIDTRFMLPEIPIKWLFANKIQLRINYLKYINFQCRLIATPTLVIRNDKVCKYVVCQKRNICNVLNTLVACVFEQCWFGVSTLWSDRIFRELSTRLPRMIERIIDCNPWCVYISENIICFTELPVFLFCAKIYQFL